MRMFTLILHYLHEVPFYSALFKKFMADKDFVPKLQSLLRGDVPDMPTTNNQKPTTGDLKWMVVQRYLAKDDENDPRLFMPHINPEAEHWFRAEEDLGRLSRMLGKDGGRLNLGYWTGLDFVGDFFPSTLRGASGQASSQPSQGFGGQAGQEQLVSFGLIDLIMSLVKKGQVKYLYHQEEALWNKIFSEYLGREKMNQLIE